MQIRRRSRATGSDHPSPRPPEMKAGSPFTELHDLDGPVDLADVSPLEVMPWERSGQESARPPLDAAAARSVRFQVAEPQGYFFPQVEAFVRQVVASFEAWEAIVAERDRRIHEMHVELGHQTEDAQRLRTEIELFKVQGAPLVDEHGAYITDSHVANVAALQAEITRLTAEVTRLTAELAAAETPRGADGDLHPVAFDAGWEAGVDRTPEPVPPPPAPSPPPGPWPDPPVPGDRAQPGGGPLHTHGVPLHVWAPELGSPPPDSTDR